ncbi:response regulator transcription factor [Duganella aceris]|uniref:Response regulator transcription factor n=1 Tax=Duganella aceris TaxID=2703883 RepID=A0ABX0FFQ9_9BURK|nr:response regulator transcription factor [Duganella aceris]NGZ83362.1 response regulator transcription factor [Duganella aceris]
MGITVLVAHRLPLIQAGLVAILAAQDGISVVPPSSTLADVAVTDFDGFMAADACWCCPVILVMPQAGEREVRAAVQHGARGYLTQTCAAAELIDAVRVIAEGCSYFDGAAAQSLRPCNLTSREREVLALLAEGGSNKAIARDLGIGCGTVKSHLKSLMHKLDVSSRTQAVVVAAQRGMVWTEHRP